MSARSPARCATTPACWASSPATIPTIRPTSEKPVPDYEAMLDGGVSGLRIGFALPEGVGAGRSADRRRHAGGGRCAGQARRHDRAGDDARLHRALSLCRSDGEMRGGRHAPAVDGEPTRLTPTRCARAWKRASSFRRRSTSTHCACAPISCASSWRRRWTASMPCCCRPSPSPCRPSRRPMSRPRAGRPTLSMVARFTGLTRPFNTLGLPALSVPCGFDNNGAPIGLQLIGRPFDEGTALPDRPRLSGRDRSSSKEFLGPDRRSSALGCPRIVSRTAQTARFTVTFLRCVKLSSMPSSENSRPMPLCLIAAVGMAGRLAERPG